MKVLIINIDKKIFELGSASLARLKEYVSFCEKLSVVVLTRQSFEPIRIGNLSVFATGSCCRAKYSFDALKLAKRIIKEENYDLVIAQDPFDTGHIGWLIKRKYKIPWQCQIHTDFLSSYFWRESLSNKIRVLAAKFLLPRADGIRVVSQRIKKSLLAIGYSLKPIAVLPIFVDVTKIKDAPIKTNLKQKYQQFDFTILMASRLSKEKNISLAIEAIAEVVKKYPKTGLIIVGDGIEKENLIRLGRIKLKDNIIFEPWSNDLVSYYKTADLFLATSNYEGWGMAPVEALGAGCPVVITDVGCAGELIQNGKNGLVVPVGDKAALVGAVARILSEVGLGQALVNAGRETIKNLPTKEQYLNEYKKSWELIV